MHSLQDLNARRETILSDIAALRRMRRGTITITRPTRTRKDGSVQQAGPFYKHQVWENGRNRTVYLSAKDYERLQPEVHNYQTLKTLTEELALINERITILEEKTPSETEEKKTSFPKRPRMS